MRYNSIFFLLLIILSESCTKEKFTPTVSGNLISVDVNTAGYKIEFYRNYYSGYKELQKYLGSTYVDSIGKFKFSYETEEDIKDMHVWIFDRNRSLVRIIKELPFPESWNRDLNISDSAFLEINAMLQNPISSNDTLYFKIHSIEGLGSDFYFEFPGPITNNFTDTVVLENYEQICTWSTNKEDLFRTNSQTRNIKLTGAPIVNKEVFNFN